MQYKLKNGKSVIIRKPTLDDAQAICIFCPFCEIGQGQFFRGNIEH